MEKKVKVTCEFGVSENCRGTYFCTPRNIRRTKKNNNGKIICLPCSRRVKYMGRNNPNCKVKSLQDDFMKNIDTEFKAWLLGWIFSDGHIRKDRITISIHMKDEDVLETIKRELSDELSIVDEKEFMKRIDINSTQFASDVSRHANNIYGKKSDIIEFPNISDELIPHFIRGFFEGDGYVNEIHTSPSPESGITSNSLKFLASVKEKTGFNFSENGTKTTIYCNGCECLDFLGFMYENAKFKMKRKYELYDHWCSWVPILRGQKNSGRVDGIFWAKTKENAVPLQKSRISDSGIDVTIIDVVKEFGNTKLYGTGIKVSPPYGYYFDLVPRSSIIKTGYMLANSVGIIDRTYRGEIMVALTKIDETMPDIELPSRIAQLILRPIEHVKLVEVESLDDTNRGSGGFGSTGK